MSNDPRKLEVALRSAFAEQLGEARFNLWFGEATRIGLDADTLEVGVPNVFFREWIQKHYAESLLHLAQSLAGRPLRLAFQIDGEAQPRAVDTTKHPEMSVGICLDPPSPGLPPINSLLIPAHPRVQRFIPGRLEEFITGPGNQLAHAAALEMAQKAGTTFNPLFLYGGVGLGKTHLLQGTNAALRARYPGLLVLYLTAEAFTNAFLEAMRTGSLGAFRSRYRGTGALLVDDVQFFAAKRATQDEFLHTFNTLLTSGAPVVLTADRHPRRITGLNDELVSRFIGGMTVKLEVPDPPTRRAILKAKASSQSAALPEPVADFIADAIRSSVRELEGALCSLIVHARLTGRKIDVGLAKTVLRDTVRHTTQSLALRDIERAVCSLFEVQAEVLKSEGRSRALSYPRMLAMFLARKHTGAAYSEIGHYFGGRNHSTVIAAEKKVNVWLRDEAQSRLLAGFETVADALSALESMLGR
jgi:chromosomal replication initiator protein